MTLMHPETRQATPTALRPFISYAKLPPHQREAFDRLQDQYDHAGTTAAQIIEAHAMASLWLGIRLRDGSQLVKCDCDSCPEGCDDIYDFADGSEYLDDWGHQRPQCHGCYSDHPQH